MVGQKVRVLYCYCIDVSLNVLMRSYLNQRPWSQCIVHRRVEGIRESGLNGLLGGGQNFWHQSAVSNYLFSRCAQSYDQIPITNPKLRLYIVKGQRMVYSLISCPPKRLIQKDIFIHFSVFFNTSRVFCNFLNAYIRTERTSKQIGWRTGIQN